MEDKMGQDAGKWISRVSHQLKRQMFDETDTEEQRELTNMQKHILHFILLESMQRDLYQRDLEKEFKVRRSTATGALQLLEKKGYLYREPVKEDARLKKIVPTKKALLLRSKLLESIRRREEQIRRGIPPEDMDVFIRVLKQISENLSYGERAKENDTIYRKEESDE